MGYWLQVIGVIATGWALFGVLGWAIAVVSVQRNNDWAENVRMLPVCVVLGPLTFAMLIWG